MGSGEGGGIDGGAARHLRVAPARNIKSLSLVGVDEYERQVLYTPSKGMLTVMWWKGSTTDWAPGS